MGRDQSGPYALLAALVSLGLMPITAALSAPSQPSQILLIIEEIRPTEGFSRAERWLGQADKSAMGTVNRPLQCPDGWLIANHQFNTLYTKLDHIPYPKRATLWIIVSVYEKGKGFAKRS